MVISREYALTHVEAAIRAIWSKDAPLLVEIHPSEHDDSIEIFVRLGPWTSRKQVPGSAWTTEPTKLQAAVGEAANEIARKVKAWKPSDDPSDI